MTEIKRYHHLPITVNPTDEIHPAGLEHPEGYWVRYSDHLAAMAEKDREIKELRRKLNEIKRRGTDLCTEATPWSDVGARIDCATNRECLRHAITEFLAIGYDGREPDENESPLPSIAAIDDKGGGG